MAFTIDPVAAVSAEPILPLALVKSHVSVEADETEWDDLLAMLRDAAVEEVERYTGKLLRPTAGLVWRGDFPVRGAIDLGRGPVTAVTSIVYLDSAASSVTVDAADYSPRVGGTGIYPATSWPCGSRSGSAVITFDAGFAAGAVPQGLLLAAMMLVASWFANREAVLTGSISSELPLGPMSIMNRYREMRI